MIRVAFFAGALLAAGCSSGPEEDELSFSLFRKIAYLFDNYNSALTVQDAAILEGVTAQLRRLVPEHFDRVMAGLSSPDEATQADAAFALGFSRNRAAIPPLEAAAGSPAITVRANALASLGMLGFDDVPLDHFKKALVDADWRMRVAALFGLRLLLTEKIEVKSNGLLDLVHSKLVDSQMQVRNEALILLRKVKRPESVDVIVAGPIKDTDSLVRSQAALTLGSIGRAATRANPHLIEMLRDEQSKVVEGAWKALNWINEMDKDRSYATWRDWYEDEQRHYYTCLEHREVSQTTPGECPTCRKKLERMPKDTTVKKPEPALIVYACPNHPEVLVTSPTKCAMPGCGKELVARKAEVTYTCPDHPGVQVMSPTKCAKPGCGKDLVPKK